MIQSRQFLQFIFLCLVATLLLLSLDYYLLAHYQGSVAAWLAKPLILLEKLIIPLRVLFLFSYFLGVTISHRMPCYYGPRYQPISIPWAVQLIAFIIAVS